MRANRTTLSLLLLAGAANAQEPPADSTACVRDADRPAAAAVSDDVGRLAALVGGRPSRPSVIRRGFARPPVACSAMPPFGDRWYRAADAAPIVLLPVHVNATYNTRYPREANNGPLWSGRGAAAMVTGGIELRYGILSATVAPAIGFTENRSFDVPTIQVPGYSPFAYPWHGATIDWPVRPGADAVTLLDPGQSAIRAEAYGLRAGLSTENIWWGAALHNPLLFSNTAAGFPHVFVGSQRPLDIWIGALEFELLWGRVAESDYFDGNPDNDGRLMAGLIVDFEPAFAPGLYIGAARTFMTVIPPGGFSLIDYVLEPYRGVRENPLGPDVGDNQIISVFARFVAPGAGLEAYAEWARDDQWGNLEDLVKEPDHSQVYT
ncbi:MAG: hypothetical protein ACRELX_17445, partial [Longimicrobiales bacterium]